MKARSLAYQFMKEICLEKKYSNLILRNELGKAQAKDKGLITQIVYGTLQNYRLCRYQWISYVKKTPTEDVCVLLDMSVYQLLYMDKMPAYAVINETVEIAKKQIHQKYANLINAVLHKVVEYGAQKVCGKEEEIVAIETSHPTWLVYMWKAQYGWEQAKAICKSDMETKPNAARVNTWRTTKSAIMESDERFMEGSLSQDALIFQGSLIQIEAYKEGLISIQDEASQLVARIVDPKPYDNVLDVCSAPGTKSNHMAELMKNKGEIICGDIHAHRVELIAQGALRLGITIMKPVVMDATKLLEVEDRLFDCVLCDVPCSGYGVLARKSDIKYHMDSSDMDTLIPLQQAILEKSSQHVKFGGTFVYSTCTLNKKENEKQVDKFLQGHEDFALISEQTIFPFTNHTDGFYVAKMIKAKNKV